MTTLVWFRRDLRLSDQPALKAAATAGGSVVPVYVWSPEEERPWSPGAATRWWLHRSLQDLDTRLRARGSKLILRSGPAHKALLTLAQECKAKAIYYGRLYEPQALKQQEQVEQTLKEAGMDVYAYNRSLLFEPDEVKTGSGGPYKVFTAYWKRCMALHAPDETRPAPPSLPKPKRWPHSLKLDPLDLAPRSTWDAGLKANWKPGESGAHSRLNRFLKNTLEGYAANRDHPATAGTSCLSPHLHFGELSPHQIWHALGSHALETDTAGNSGHLDTYVRQLGWREFAHYLLYHFPHTTDHPLDVRFKHFPWRNRKRLLTAWQQGRTGYPLVDAGMRQLWATGWMHNRVRMIAASFLIKDLLIPWQEGAKWFWDTLVDADLANNTLGWQWTAGCGADAAPFFRVFNPGLQSKKFDAEGTYIRRWVPELRAVPARYIHAPAEAPAAKLKDAGVTLGRSYPRPLVDHEQARDEALAGWQEVRTK